MTLLSSLIFLFIYWYKVKNIYTDSVPIISIVISTFATASFVATSVAAGLLTASTASLSSIGTFSPPFSSVSDPASNLFVWYLTHFNCYFINWLFSIPWLYVAFWQSRKIIRNTVEQIDPFPPIKIIFLDILYTKSINIYIKAEHSIEKAWGFAKWCILCKENWNIQMPHQRQEQIKYWLFISLISMSQDFSN